LLRASLLALVPWWRCSLLDPSAAPSPPAPQPVPPSGEQAPQRVTDVPPRSDPPVRLSDAAVLRALDAGRAAFQHCVDRAHLDDPTLDGKVELRIYVDALGVATSVEPHVTNAKFAACLTRVAKRLKFPPPGRGAVADITFVAH
jgi:hypothetical protein